MNGNQLDVGLVVDVMTNTALRGQGLFVRSGLEAIKRLEKTNVKTVIGFPIRKEVLPGKKFEIDAQVISWNRGICKGRGIATVDGEVACEADMLITIPDILEQFLPTSKK